MAESKKSKSFGRKPVPISAGTGPQVEETAPDPGQTVQEAPPEPSAEARPEKRRGRPANPKTSENFWNAVQEIPADEWRDKRAYVYIYLREPFCDLKTEGQPGYLLKVHEPIDPDFIMHRWGSGKYYLWAKRRNQGAKTDYTHADLTFEVFNPDFPPKLPRALWDKDSRNDRWLALLPKEQPPAPPPPGPAPLEQVTDFLRLGNELRKEAREEFMRDAPAAPAAPAQQPGGIKEVFEAAAQVLNMRSDNPMVEMLGAELKSIRAELAAEREAGRKLEADLSAQRLKVLEDKLTDTLNRLTQQPKPAESDDWLEKLEKAEERKERLKNLFGGGETSSRRRSFGEMALEWGEKILTSPAVAGIGQAVVQRMMMGPPPPGMAGAPAPQVPQGQAQPQTPQQEFEQFIPIATKAMLGYLSNSENTGDMFADWMYAGFPDKFEKLKSLTHPMMPGQQGAPVIIAFYQHSPYWQAITAFEGGEERFKKFVGDFCAYRPEASENSGTDSIQDAEHEDIDTGEAETTELNV